jgi:hypothetical protein
VVLFHTKDDCQQYLVQICSEHFMTLTLPIIMPRTQDDKSGRVYWAKARKVKPSVEDRHWLQGTFPAR